MTPIAALVLGIIQGITEFLPISSSAHLALAHHFFDWNVKDNLTFDVALHFGTLVAILIFFARDWGQMFARRDRMLWFVLAASVPGAIAGALLEDAAESTFRGLPQMALLLAVMALLMAAAERWGRKAQELGQMRFGEAMLIGLAQALAIMPGVSRSGVTMTAGLAFGLTREAAARFSFLLATPIMLGATLYQCRHLFGSEAGTVTWLPLIIGVVASGVTGFAAIAFLLRFLRQHSFYPFVFYRLALAAVIIVSVYFAAGA
ncbi:MAG: undecaprenyl-diphosphate phosphatase [Bacteroidota bacterium]